MRFAFAKKEERERTRTYNTARRDTERFVFVNPVFVKNTREIIQKERFRFLFQDSFRTARRSVVFSHTAVACVFVRQVRCR